MDQSTNAPALHDGYAKMTPLCTTSLRESFDPSRQLFSRQLLDGRWCAVDDVYPHETLTSTSIALVGIARAGFDPADHGVEVGRCITAIAGEIRRTDYLGGIGLALWANAVSGNSWSASHLLGEVGLDLEAFIDRVLPTLTTMEVAWAASGLLHELHRCGDGRVRDAAKACVAELVTMRFSARTGLMNHAGRQASLSHRARSHIANFADQIYSVQALAFASLAVGDQTAVFQHQHPIRPVARAGEIVEHQQHPDSRIRKRAEGSE